MKLPQNLDPKLHNSNLSRIALSRTWLNDGTEEQKLGLKLQQKIELVEKEELGSNVAQNLISQLEIIGA